jgi:hypothetical protein
MHGENLIWASGYDKVWKLRGIKLFESIHKTLEMHLMVCNENKLQNKNFVLWRFFNFEERSELLSLQDVQGAGGVSIRSDKSPSYIN